MQASADDCAVHLELTQFQSLMHAGWYTIMTMTTVGCVIKCYSLQSLACM